MTSRHRLVLAASTALAAIVAAPTFAAYICHPDPSGTRTLALSGTIERYLVAGPKVSVAVRSPQGCTVVAWNVLTGLHKATTASCATLLARNLEVSRDPRTRIQFANATRPDTLEVFSGQHRVASWPLPARPRALHVAAGYALFTAADGGTYALRLADGRIAGLGPAQTGDDPQIGPLGAVFARRPGYTTLRASSLKFVPLDGIAHEVDMNTLPLVTGGSIRSISMDGPRVAVAVRDPAGRCDRVLYWNVLRAPFQRISAPVGPTCVPDRATAISSVAIGGFRAEWLAHSSAGAALVVGSPKCQEWVVRRLAAGERVTAMAADGATIAFADTHTVAVVVGKYSARTILTARVSPTALAVSGKLVATALDDGTVVVRTISGRHVARLHVGAVRAIALDNGRLAVLRAGAIDVYGLASGKRVRTIETPGVTSASLDVQYGIATVAAGYEALAIDLATGRVAIVGSAAAPIIGTTIEAPGVAYASPTGDHGTATFVPLSRVKVLLGRA
jgi:hypothetical protein